MAKKRNAASSNAADKIDAEMARAALQKRQRGDSPTRQELAALRRVEKAREEAARWEYYATIPKKHWVEMSGRQHKLLADAATRYGVPIGGRTIDLGEVVRWLHDFLVRNGPRLAAGESDDPLMQGDSSPALERYRAAKADLAELELEKQRRALLPRDEVHDALARAAGILRGLGETMQRQFGTDALLLLDEGLDDFERELESLADRDEVDSDG